ncbi:MAG: class I SAM-dependent methyltransferase [candidate division Zixibacteria bacterium]|nr:class I SAM-dependent methyltransferase [candidate division Zixibacteria bacterium]
MIKNTDWWNDFFPTFRSVFYRISKKDTNAQVRYIIKKLNISPGNKFLDCPCGIGRIALPLAGRGIKVTGIDIIPSYLEELGKKAKRQDLMIKLVRNDMRRINFKEEFDAGANLWTSYGYFEKESDNLLVLKKMYQALKPGGKFMLHVINRDWIMANYSPRDWFQAGDIRVLEKRKFDYATSINHSEWCFLKEGKETSHQVIIRMYSYHELIAMFKSVGFVDINGYGTIKDEPISRDTMMMFIIGTKPRKKSDR